MASQNITYISVNVLRNFICDVFIALGVPEKDAQQCADVLITSDLRGIESHGIGRLKYYYDRIKRGQHNPVTETEIIRESPTTAVIDGHNGMGMIIGIRSMQMAIDKARLYGMGSVAVRNSTHFGIDGYYPLMATKAGMIGMSFTNARPAITPTFGAKPMLGTNPISFGAPTDEDFPFLFDAATSITQRGKIEVLSREGKSTPEGWVVDQEGNFVINPDLILKYLSERSAAFLPLGGAGEILGGHKGYCLATMVEILSASLQGGSFLYGLIGLDNKGNHQPFKVGHFFMAINIESFIPLEEFKTTTGTILRELRNSPKVPGFERIYTAGEKEFEKEKIIRLQGISINPSLKRSISIMIRELRLTKYKYLLKELFDRDY